MKQRAQVPDMSALKTSRRVTKSTSSTSKGNKASGKLKALAGSTLSQSQPSKTTSEVLARTAAKVLANPRSSKSQKQSAESVLSHKTKPFPVKTYRVAGSTLTQTKSGLIVRKVARKATK
jgi:hypothetical protein